MSTYQQLQKKIIIKKKNHCWAARLYKNPQRKGAVIRVRINTPRKPNSARRPVAKIIFLPFTKITAHIPGIGHNIRRFSTVLVRGGGARDLPGSYYSCVRGVYDFLGVLHKTKRRSIYGVSWPAKKKKHLKRKIRNL